MTREDDIKSFSVAELQARRGRGESGTDLARVRAKTDAELEQDIRLDPDLSDLPESWQETAEAVPPIPQTVLSLRLDADLVDWFKRQGPGYQARINAALRAFVDQGGK